MTAKNTQITKAENQTVPATVTHSVLARLAGRYHTDGSKLLDTLKNTAFRGATNDQLLALCIVADQYRLNPFTKEIYAFPDKGGGIVPVVGIDGWLRIINDHPQMDGMDIAGDDDQCTVTIYRKDRSRPTVATEYAAECARNTEPWRSHPARMLRHKAIIQCSRIAFGFALKDPDEAERIIEAQASEIVDRPAIMPPRIINVEPTPEPTPETAQPETQAQAPEPTPQPGELVTVGKIEDVQIKSGGTKEKPWKKYGIRIGGMTLGTFDTAIGEEAQAAIGVKARVHYEVKGKYMTVTRFELLENPDAEPVETVGSDDYEKVM